MTALTAGTACVDITPPVGLDIAGSLWARPATGTRDPLRCKALVLDGGRTRAAIVALDLLNLERSEVLRARELVTAQTGILGPNVLIACSHTHLGPSTRRRSSAAAVSDAYMEELPRRIAAAVSAAASEMVPVEWGCASADEPSPGRYRRVFLANGRVWNTW